MKHYLPIFLTMVLLLCGCQADNTNPNNQNNNNNGKNSSQITSLQAVIDNATSDTINLSQYPNITNYNATVNKSLTITGESKDLENATLNISSDGVSLSGLSNVNITTTNALGSGSLSIAGSSLNSLVLNGGGSNSIHLKGTKVKDATANYEGVRIAFDDTASSINNLSAKTFCKIDSSSDSENALVDSLELKENAVVDLKTSIGKVDVKGKNARLNLSEHSSTINSLADIATDYLGTFKLITVEKVNLPNSIDTSVLTRVHNKTSHSILPSTTKGYDEIEFNYDELLKAWKENKDSNSDFWKNYQNLRILDKNNIDKITGIRHHGLQMCEWLTSVDIGENVSKIGKHVFLGCHNLRSVTVRATTPPTLDGNIFYAIGDSTSDIAIDTELFSYKNDNITAEGIDIAIDFFKSQSGIEKGDVASSQAKLNECDNALANLNCLSKIGLDVTSLGTFLKCFYTLPTFKDEALPLITDENKVKLFGLPEDFDLRYIDPDYLLEKIVSCYKIVPVDLNKVKIYVPANSVGAYKSAWSQYANCIQPMQ